jgi:hypothetical protein
VVKSFTFAPKSHPDRVINLRSIPFGSGSSDDLLRILKSEMPDDFARIFGEETD